MKRYLLVAVLFSSLNAGCARITDYWTHTAKAPFRAFLNLEETLRRDDVILLSYGDRQLQAPSVADPEQYLITVNARIITKEGKLLRQSMTLEETQFYGTPPSLSTVRQAPLYDACESLSCQETVTPDVVSSVDEAVLQLLSFLQTEFDLQEHQYARDVIVLENVSVDILFHTKNTVIIFLDDGQSTETIPFDELELAGYPVIVMYPHYLTQILSKGRIYDQHWKSRLLSAIS